MIDQLVGLDVVTQHRRTCMFLIRCLPIAQDPDTWNRDYITKWLQDRGSSLPEERPATQHMRQEAREILKSKPSMWIEVVEISVYRVQFYLWDQNVPSVGNFVKRELPPSHSACFERNSSSLAHSTTLHRIDGGRKIFMTPSQTLHRQYNVHGFPSSPTNSYDPATLSLITGFSRGCCHSIWSLKKIKLKEDKY